MSSGDYSVAVKLSLINNVSSGLVSMASQFRSLSRESEAFQAKLNSLRFQGKVGASMVGFGTALAAPFLLAVKQAGKLEQQLYVIKTATQANVQQMEDYRKSIERVGSQTIFSSIKVAEMGKIIATTGNFKISELAKVTQEFAKFATVQKMLKGTDHATSTKMGLQLAEITGHFDAASVKSSLNMLTKLSLIMPDNIQQVLGSMKYMQGTVKNVMGVEDQEGMLFVAMLNRLGISGTRAGSMLTAAISRSIPGVMGSGLWEGKSGMALSEMGMVDATGHANYFNKQGKFDALKWMSLMGAYVQKEFAGNSPGVARENIMKNFQFAYGANGARIAGLLSSNDALEQYKMLQTVMRQFPDMDKIAEQMNGLFNVQLPKAYANFETVFTKLGYVLLPVATQALKYFNDNATKLVDWMQAHEELIQNFAKGFLWIAGLSALGGTLLLLKVGLTGLFLPLRLLAGLLPGISGALVGLNLYGALVIGGIAAVGFALYELYVHWDVVIAKINEVYTAFSQTQVFYVAERAFYYLGATMYHILHPVETLGKALDWLFNTINGWIQKITSIWKSPVNDGTQTSFWGSQSNDGKQPNAGANLPPRQTIAEISRESPYVRGNVHLMSASSGWKNESDKKENQQPIEINLHLDGQKVAKVVANAISESVSRSPSSTSMFDTSQSLMPPIVNAIGIT